MSPFLWFDKTFLITLMIGRPKTKTLQNTTETQKRFSQKAFKANGNLN